MSFELWENMGIVLKDEEFSGCAPHLIKPAEVSQALRSSSNNYDHIVDEAKKYYASELIDLSLDDYHSISLLKKNLNELNENEIDKLNRLSKNIYDLIKLNDVCDKEGIRYLASLIFMNNNQQDSVESANSIAVNVLQYLSTSEKDVIVKAKSMLSKNE